MSSFFSKSSSTPHLDVSRSGRPENGASEWDERYANHGNSTIEITNRRDPIAPERNFGTPQSRFVVCRHESSLHEKSLPFVVSAALALGLASPAKALTHAFIWNSDTGMTDLGSLADGEDSFAAGINVNGQVVG